MPKPFERTTGAALVPVPFVPNWKVVLAMKTSLVMLGEAVKSASATGTEPPPSLMSAYAPPR